jgi:hypothetical protein
MSRLPIEVTQFDAEHLQTSALSEPQILQIPTQPETQPQQTHAQSSILTIEQMKSHGIPGI